MRDPRDMNFQAVLAQADAQGLSPHGKLAMVMTVLAESDGYRYSNPLYPLSSQVPNDGPPPIQYASSTKNSLGLFQQRPQWWGTGTEDEKVRQLMDPAISARLFINKLRTVKDWQNKEPWVAAQDVQGSEYNGVTVRNGQVLPYGGNYQARLEQAQKVLAGGTTYFTDQRKKT